MAEQLGFIGLGNMGSRLAANLFADNGNMTVWNRTESVARERSPKGAVIAPSIEQLVKSCDLIFMSVSDDTAARAVIEAVAKYDLSDKVIIDFSTLSPGTSVQLADKVRAQNGFMLDAAVSGSTPQVEARSLVLLVGGDEAAYKQCKQYIAPLGSAIFHMGENGNGLKMKLCVNALLGIGVQAIAEALVLGQKSGLDRAQVIDVLSQTAVVSPSQKAKLELAKANGYDKVAFGVSLMYKDFGLIHDQAQLTATPMPVTAASRQIAAAGVAEGKSVDMAVVIKVLEDLAGIQAA